MGRRYKILQQEVFEKGAYRIVPIRHEDRHLIRKWRNEQLYHLRQTEPLSEGDQDRYFETVVAALFEKDQTDQLLFSYLKGDTCIGYGGLVHINWRDKHAEISFIMDTTLEATMFSYHWANFTDLIERVAFDHLALHKVFVYAFDLRPHLYDALRENNFFKDAVLNEHCFYDGKFIDVVIHSKISDK